MKFSATSVDITPATPVTLGAAGKPDQLSDGVDSRLEANILCLADVEKGSTVVIVSVDLLYAGEPITAAIEEHLSGRAGVHVFVCASHTHRAPMTDPRKPSLGGFNESYVASVVDALKPAVDDCLGGLRDVDELRVGRSVADSSVNRRVRKRIVVARRPRLNSFVHAPNPGAPKDETITVIEIHGRSGVECIVWNYACHPVGYPAPDRVSAHFPGWVRDHLRAEEGSRVPVLFLQGYSGNIRPSGTSRVHSIGGRLLQLVAGKMFEDFRSDDYVSWCTELTSSVNFARRNSSEMAMQSIQVRRRVRPASDFIEDEPGQVEVARVSLGNAIEFFFANGELMVEHGLQLRETYTETHVVPVGCVGRVIGYLPTPKIHEEGGYEGGTFTQQFRLGSMREQAAGALEEMFSSLQDPHQGGSPDRGRNTRGADRSR